MFNPPTTIKAYRAAVYNESQPEGEKLMYREYNQHPLAYVGNVIAITAGLAGLVFTGMFHWNAHLFSTLSKANRDFASYMLLGSGIIFTIFPSLFLSLRLNDKGVHSLTKDIDLESDEVQEARLRASAGKPEKRDGKKYTAHCKTIEINGRKVHYTLDEDITSKHDMTEHYHALIQSAFKKAATEGQSFEETLPEILQPLTLSPNVQLVIDTEDSFICANYGDNIAYIVRGPDNKREFIPLSEAQSENPYFEKKRTVVTIVEKKEGDRLVIGARETPKMIQKNLTDIVYKTVPGSTADALNRKPVGRYYTHTESQIVELSQGQQVGGE